jgi:tRNA dimethylallyltransferase
MELEEQEGPAFLAADLQSRDPETAAKTDLNNPVRVRRALERLESPTEPIKIKLPPFTRFKFGLNPEAGVHELALRMRTQAMMKAGWVQEVEDLLAAGVSTRAPGMRAIGYEQVIGLIEGRLDSQEAEDSILLATRQYAKRQRTWLRSEPDLIEIDTDLSEGSVEMTLGLIQDCLDRRGSK